MYIIILIFYFYKIIFTIYTNYALQENLIKDAIVWNSGYRNYSVSFGRFLWLWADFFKPSRKNIGNGVRRVKRCKDKWKFAYYRLLFIRKYILKIILIFLKMCREKMCCYLYCTMRFWNLIWIKIYCQLDQILIWYLYHTVKFYSEKSSLDPKNLGSLPCVPWPPVYRYFTIDVLNLKTLKMILMSKHLVND